MQDESHWVYENRKHIHWSLNHINWSLNGCQWDINWWQFDISESEILADVNAIRRILVIVSGISADADEISAEYQWNWWNISNIVANTISVVIKIVGFFLLRETISFVRKPIEKLRTISEINAFICESFTFIYESYLFIQGKFFYLPQHF